MQNKKKLEKFEGEKFSKQQLRKYIGGIKATNYGTYIDGNSEDHVTLIDY